MGNLVTQKNNHIKEAATTASLQEIIASNHSEQEYTKTAVRQRWFEQLSRPISQSIEYYSDPRNLGKRERKNVYSWVVAGVSEDNVRKFEEKVAKEFGIFSNKSKPNLEGFGMEELQLISFTPSKRSAFMKLKRRAERLGLKIWQEPKVEIGATGPINTRLIQEGTFDIDLNDIDTATDVNGDGDPDPLWHLLPSDTASAQYGVNAIGAWRSVSGENVNIGVFDSFFDLNHSDLNSAMPTNFDWDGDGVNDGIDNNANGTPDIFESEHFTLPGGDINWPVVPPTNLRAQSHGTSVAGIALGRINGQSGIGVAPESNFMPNGFLDNGNQWRSTNYFDMADVINHSWGRSRGLGQLRTAPPILQANWQMALDGAIQVKSAGNSRNFWDNTNNSMVSNRKNIIVGATMANGEVEDYSTPGASLFISAPVNGSNVRWWSDRGRGSSQFTTTSDVTDESVNNADNRGYADGSTYSKFNGTSAAAPMVTGVIAMMLEANPTLTLRDVQHILAETSVKNGLMDSNGDGSLDSINPNAGGDASNPDNPAGASTLELRDSFSTTMATTTRVADGHNTGWFQNGAGHWLSDSFGFGIVDAGAAVQASNNWPNVSDELKATTNAILSNPYIIPEGNLGGLDSLTEAGSWTVRDPLKVEWVELTLNLNLPEQDEIMLAVKSPSGTRSVLMAPGGSNTARFNNERTLITNQFWGEPSSGEWTVEVLDTRIDADNATISNAKLDIYGTCDQQSPLKVTSFNELATNGIGLDVLAQKFLSDGGANSSEYDLLSVIPFGDARSFGTFESGYASGLKIDQGTIFTTGHAKDAIGPNSAPNTTTNWQELGTPLLGANSKDASGFEIRFKVKKDISLNWKAQFGSEEFDEWSPSIYNDKAGIFLAEINGNKTANLYNLLGSPDNQEFSVNEFSYDKSLLINEPCGPVTWEYDGVTGEAIQSKKAILRKGRSYVIIPVIADTADPYFDSGMIIGSAKTVPSIQTLPDFESLGTKDLNNFLWGNVDVSKLSEGQINSINWDNVALNITRGRRGFDYDSADWNAIIESDSFGAMAAQKVEIQLLPDQSLSEESSSKLLELNPKLQMDDLTSITLF